MNRETQSILDGAPVAARTDASPGVAVDAAAFHAGLRHVLELLAEDAPLETLLAELIRILESQSRSGMLGSILLLDPTTGRLRHGAGPSLPDAYNDAIDGISIGPDVGACGAAAYTRQPVHATDVRTDPRWVAFLDLTETHGLRACWSTPILSRDGQVLGTFAMYYRHPHTPDVADRELVEVATRTAMLAIERKRNEATLRENERLLTQVFEAAPAFMAVVRGPDMVFEKANRAYLNLIGANRSIIGKSLRDALPEIADTPFPRILGDVMETGQPFYGKDVPVPLRRSVDGPLEERRVDFVYEPLRDTDGSITGVMAHGVDLTERVAAEEALRQSRAALEFTLESAQVGDWDLDLTTDTARRSLRHDRCFGYADDAPDWGFDTFIRHVHPDDRERVKCAFQEAVSQLKEWHFECRVVWPDGSVHWIAAHGSLYRAGGNPQHRPTRMLGIVADITDRKSAEEVIRHSELRNRFVMDSMPQKLFTALADGSIDYFNPAWVAFTGLSSEQMADWSLFVHPDDIAENIRVWQDSIDTREPFQFEQRFRRSDGEYRWHLSRAAAMKDAEGQVLMWIGSNTDIHEQKQTADELRKLADELSDADRRKNEFIALLAHELRNPLAPISNALQIMRLGGDPRHLAFTTDVLERQVTHLVRLVDDLLDISRISRGKIELRRQQVDLVAAARNAVEAARALVDDKRQTLLLTLPGEAIQISADPTRLVQIIGNLITNASKFTDAGGRIELAVEREDLDAVLRVADTGIGIADDQLHRIFDMFTQLDTSLERSVSGLGIGLSLVRTLVELHGGTVAVRSDGLGLGTEFTVRLPIAQA